MAFAIAMAGIGAFQYIHWHEHQMSDEMGLAAAQACASMLEFADMQEVATDPNSQGYAECRDAMRELCRRNRMDYMYAYRCDLKTGEITYLFCVADDDANNAIVELERGFGTVVQGPLSNQELAALSGHETSEALELNNQFGHMLAWFCKVDGWSGNVLAGADYSVSEQRERVFAATSQVVLIIIIAFLALLLVQLYVLRKYVFRPVGAIAERMRGFSADKAGEFEPIDVNSRDEMGEIADAFGNMAAEIDVYLKDIERMTSERVQANVEMDVARRIQLGVVPERLELEGPGFDLRAFARTAREVGGDFYDCLSFEDGRIAATVGDVSGKGVAASLFMAMTKTMIHDRLASGETPAAALNQVNERLCQSNPEGMFVTVFTAVYDPVTGEVQYANAGHMPPLLVGDDVRPLDAEPGVLLGLFEDAGLENAVVSLSDGEGLLMYTDGATEAVNPDNEFFGEERFAAAICSEAPYERAGELVDAAVRSVDAFSESREQFDDMTLLALVRHASGPAREASGFVCYGADPVLDASDSIQLPVDIASFTTVREAILATACDEDLKRKACLACEEAFANVVLYSEAENVWFDVVEEDDGLRMVLSDDGVPFDPTAATLAEKEFEDRDGGGMGISLVRQLTSELSYRRAEERNVLAMLVKRA